MLDRFVFTVVNITLKESKTTRDLGKIVIKTKQSKIVKVLKKSVKNFKKRK